MNINLMPREPLFDRFYHVWLALTILSIIAFAVLCYYVYALETETVQALQERNSEMTRTKEELSQELAAYREREAFWQENEPYYVYRDAVESQGAVSHAWDEILSAMEEALPSGGQIIQVEVTDRVAQGLAVVHSVDGAASFVQRMHDVLLVEDVALEAVNAPEEFAPLHVEGEQASVIRFRLTAAKPEQSDAEDRRPEDEA